MVHARRRTARLLLVTLLVALGLLGSGVLLLPERASAEGMAGPVQLQVTGMEAVVSNGIYTIKFNSSGTGYSLVWKGKEIIGPAKGFYSSVNGGTGFTPTQLNIVVNTPEMADIAYISTWGELHYVVRSNVSGLYSYFVATNIGTVGEFRTLYRVDGSIFRNGYNGERTGTFPTLAQIQQAQKLQDETYKLADGTVYTKYDYSTYMTEDLLHGVYGNGYGVWMISPSHEYNNGGPMKQELMVHVESATGDGVVLNMLSAGHFGNPSVTIPSGKIYGPWLVYFNNGSIEDARAQAFREDIQWPYRWLSNPNYPLNRTLVVGALRLADGRPAAGAEVILAQPGGDVYTQGSGYIFYTRANFAGLFAIPNVRPGTYSLYAYATGGSIGDITDQYEHDNVNVGGLLANVGLLTWSPQKYAHFLWQIGTADRRADEFKLGNLPRQYGLFKQTPTDLTYTIGQSTPANDWYYAQTQVGTWTVNFNLNQTYSGNAHLTVALAGMSRAPTIQVGVNGTTLSTLPNSVSDPSIYRSADQSGYYHLIPITFPTSLLKVGANSVTFQATNAPNGSGAMFDTIKLETD